MTDSSTRRAVLLAGVAAVVLALTIAVMWWVRHPTVFDPAGNGLGFSEARVGKGYHVAVVQTSSLRTDPVRVRIHDLRPVMAQGSAPAAVGFSYCVESGRGGIGAVTGDLGRWCSELGRAEGAELSVGGPLSEQASLIMTVVPLAPGPVHVRAVEIAYGTGLQRGTQTVGPFVRLTARRS